MSRWDVPGKGEQAGRLMIERSRTHQCTDPDGFCKGIAKIVNEAVGSHLQLGEAPGLDPRPEHM